MNTDYRYVVVGCGDLGSAAAYWLSRVAGGDVLGLERYGLGHERAAPWDRSRIIGYVQREDAYAALAPAAYGTWRDIERRSGLHLVHETGGLLVEDVAARTSTGYRGIGDYVAVAERRGVDFELLDAEGLRARWPQFRLAGTEQAVYQRRSGFVDLHRATAAHIALARGHGAAILQNAPVHALRDAGGHVEVVTDDETYRAEHVLLTADAGTNDLLDDLGQTLPLTVAREQVTYLATPHLLDFSSAVFPVFTWHGTEDFYGFPVHGEVATKLGQRVDSHDVTAEIRSAEPDPACTERQRAFLAEHLPGFAGPQLFTRTCRYSTPRDQHFVLDVVPGHPRVGVGIGAGHALPFASLLGRILAELATTGRTRHPIACFTLEREALTDPAFGRISNT